MLFLQTLTPTPVAAPWAVPAHQVVTRHALPHVATPEARTQPPKECLPTLKQVSHFAKSKVKRIRGYSRAWELSPYVGTFAKVERLCAD